MLKTLRPVHSGWATPDPRPVRAFARPATPSVGSDTRDSLDAHIMPARKLPAARFGKRYTAKKVPEMVMVPGPKLLELSKPLKAGAEGTFMMARCTNRYGETSFLGVKRALATPRRTLKRVPPKDGPLAHELKGMLAAHREGKLYYTPDTHEELLVMELGDNTLDNAIWNVHDACANPAMREAFAVDVLLQTCESLLPLHKSKYAHRDIKPENILVTLEGKVIVADFGKNSDKGRAETTPTGAPGFGSLAMLRGKTAVIADDMWNVGVVGAMLIKAENPFHPDRDFSHLDAQSYYTHWQKIASVEMDGYLRWRQGDTADTIGDKIALESIAHIIPDYNARIAYLKEYNTAFFEGLPAIEGTRPRVFGLRELAPNLAPIIEALLDPDPTKRPDIGTVYEKLLLLKEKLATNDLKAVWAHVERDPVLDAQHKAFEDSGSRVPLLAALALEGTDRAL